VLAIFSCVGVTSAVEVKFLGGNWVLRDSYDGAGANWKRSKLVFKSAEDAGEYVKLKGYFDWKRNGEYVGREYFTGKFNKSRSTLNLRGIRLVNPEGIVLAQYYAKATQSERPTFKGSWNGSNVTAGRWFAVFKE
jgi:hypothetical protein